tara:strand:- start:1085 stop:1363 length:279 start_codon:yes stop_codon:yes gene_type:complete
MEYAFAGILFTLLVVWIVIKNEKDEDKSGGGVTTPPVSGPSLNDQRKTFAKMTVPELKSYVKENKNKLGESKGRMPTKKADLIEASLEIWEK